METGSETEKNVINKDTVLVIAVISLGLEAIDGALIKVNLTLGKHPNDGNCQDKEDVVMLNKHCRALAERGGKARYEWSLVGTCVPYILHQRLLHPVKTK
jgi:hypothetical protein